MNKINFKKIAPGIISVVIIAGMAIQSFATNVDMAAFVKKDTYMTKYYELDFRIDDIEKSLARTYRFVCTNLKSYGGTANTYAFPPGVAFCALTIQLLYSTLEITAKQMNLFLKCRHLY